MCLYFSAIGFSDIRWRVLSMQKIFTSSGCASFCFWCSTLFTAVVAFWMEILDSIKAHAHWRPCAYLKCISGLHRLEKLTFSWCIQVLDLVPKCCPDKKARNGINFSFPSLCCWMQMHGYLAWVFSMCWLGSDIIFFYIALLLKRLLFCSKSELTRNGHESDILCSIVVCFVVAISAWLKLAKNAHFCFASVDIKSFRWVSLGVFYCVLGICLYFWDIELSDIDWWASSMQHNFTSYDCTSSAFFLVTVDQKCFWWLLKIDYAYFNFFCNVNGLLMFYSFQCKSSFLNENTEAK